MMQMIKTTVFLVILMTVRQTNGYSSGNVGLACDTMSPLHLTLSFGPQSSDPPYEITATRAAKGTFNGMHYCSFKRISVNHL